MPSTADRRTMQTEWKRMIDHCNDTSREYPRDLCIHDLFEVQVEKTPDAVAVVAGVETLTYRELNERSNRLARFLRGSGAGPERWVAIFLDRSAYLPVAMLAVIKAGAAYAPMDPKHPRDRLMFQTN